MSDIEREAFEKWWSPQGHYAPESASKVNAWRAWQAARAQGEASSAGAVPEWLIRQCEEAIDDAAQNNGGTLNGVRSAQKKVRDLLTAAPTAPAGSPEPVAIVNHWSIAGKSGGSGVSATGIENLPDGTKLYTHPHNGEPTGECIGWMDPDDLEELENGFPVIVKPEESERESVQVFVHTNRAGGARP